MSQCARELEKGSKDRVRLSQRFSLILVFVYLQHPAHLHHRRKIRVLPLQKYPKKNNTATVPLTAEMSQTSKIPSAEIDARMAKLVDFVPLAGIAVGIQFKGESYEQGCGLADVQNGKAVTAQTVFRIASLTKSFTAAAIPRLGEEGKLRLDDPISRFLPGTPDVAEDLIHVQVVAVMRLTRAALSGMIARGRGSIINVSSRLAFSGPLGSTQLPKHATYAGTKSFVITFTQFLQSELEGTRVQAQVLCPSLVRTEFHEKVGMDPDRFPSQLIMRAEDLVEASLVGLKRGEVICIPAIEDADLLKQLQDDQRQLFETSATGKVATRYSTKKENGT
jgi:NAD(P)-dependent dehydrogenase (short-subunit alcohol dehydrogenase family)